MVWGNEKELESYREQETYNSDYYDSLYAEGNVLLLNLGSNYMSEGYQTVLAEGIYEMVQHEGPYLVHCLEGKDRTGFVCALLLCLSGATVQEIVDDYMITYRNYYSITRDANPERYDAVKDLVYDFIEYLTGSENVDELSAENLVNAAKWYLSISGLDDEQIEEIVDKLCE